jgi:hydroxyethylthiazole kinase
MNKTIVALTQKIWDEQPLIHCITNHVVANFQANGLLALGASPVMADALEEVVEMSAAASCTVLNIGTLKKETIEAMILAGKSANEQGNPVVLDPVGVGATAFRKQAIFRILDEVDVTLIRCNAGELMAIAKVEWQAKGVDAGTGNAEIEVVAKKIATDYNCLVAITGSVDYVTDGDKILVITGGDPMMSRVTGMGCLLSAVAGAFLTTSNDNQLDAVACGLTFYKDAGQHAAAISEGPGDFAINFLNMLATPILSTKTGGILQ